jgi:hypothetical protein
MTAVDAYMRAANRIRIVDGSCGSARMALAGVRGPTLGMLNGASAERQGRRPDDRCLSQGLYEDGHVGGVAR